MRRTILSIIATLAIVVGVNLGFVDPALGHYLPPGQWYTQSDACTHSVIYGNFGDGFAQLKLLSDGCSIYTTVEVTTAHSGHTHVQPCSVGAAIFNPAPHCFLTGATDHTTIQATVHGTALKVRTIGCGASGGCITRSHGVYE